jgi:tetratricopeptide (TPR) repeat protein
MGAFSLGKAWHERGEPARALASYSNAIALDAEYAAAHCNLGLALIALGRAEEAVASAAVRSKSNRHRMWRTMVGLALQRLGRVDDAVASYQRSDCGTTDFADAYCNLGVIAGDRSQYAEAAECFRKAVQARPELPEPHYNLGCTLFGLNQAEEAIGEFQAAVQRRLATGRRSAWPASSAAPRAVRRRARMLQPGVQLAPEAAEARQRLALVLREMGRMQEAIAEFERAIALRPGFAEALADLATAIQRLGDLEAAATAWRRAIAADPGYPLAYCGLELC